MNLIHIWYHPFSIQGRAPYLYDFVRKTFNVGLYSDICRPVSFKLGLMTETTQLYILFKSVWMTWTFKVTAVWEIKIFGVHFVTNLIIDLDEIK